MKAMNGKFQPEFDRVGLAICLAALLILLYFGLTVEGLAQNLWVAYALWLTGFFGTFALGLARRSQTLNLQGMFMVFVGVALIFLCFYGVSFAYASVPQDIAWGSKAISFGIGVSEELFFGVFALGLLINWLHVAAPFAIAGTSLVHALFHIPNWGTNPSQIAFFFICFVVARSIYVYVFPKVGVLVGAHGLWNLWVT